MVADALADQRGRADLGQGGAARRRGIEAARDVLGGGFVDPVAQLVVDVAVGGGAARQHAQAVGQVSPEGHHASAFSSRATAAARRVHCAVSSSRRLRPARVSE